MVLIPALAVGARRLHDVGKSGWWQLISITVIGLIPLIIWWAQPGGKSYPLKSKSSSRSKLSMTEELKELKALYKEGSITKSEFEKAKKKLLKDYFLNKKNKLAKIYDNVLSDEGGRFYNCEIRYKALKLTRKMSIKIPQNYLWLSQNQIIEMIKRKKIDIEARLLFGCINIKKIK